MEGVFWGNTGYDFVIAPSFFSMEFTFLEITLIYYHIPKLEGFASINRIEDKENRRSSPGQWLNNHVSHQKRTVYHHNNLWVIYL